MSKITKQQAFEFLIDMEAASEDGNSWCDQVAISEGQIVAHGFSCQKEGCNCTGNWWNGNPNNGEVFSLSELQSIEAAK